MIAILRGILIYKSTTDVIIDCGGVGYSVSISINTGEKLPEIGSEVKIFTLLIPREDSLNLYGFYEETEREAFKMLTSVSGVGAKIAMGILSSLPVESLQEYIFTGNLPALQKLPGIGKKTAERIVVELKDRIFKLGTFEKFKVAGTSNVVRQEAIAALVTLGYNQQVADKAVKKAIEESAEKELTTDVIIRKSLKFAMNI